MTINVKKLLTQGEKALLSGNIELAKAHYQTILNNFPKNSKARGAMAKIDKKSNLKKLFLTALLNNTNSRSSNPCG